VGLLMQTSIAATNRVKRFLSRVRDKLRLYTGARGSGEVETIAAGDFRIDLENRTATLRGRPLQLTGEEFDLLMFLIDHPRKLITQQTRLATNWDGHGLRQTEFLRVLLSLRKKLEFEGSSQHYIRTEPWVFYRFDPGAPQAL
jgi:two-component system KDP operon response regulator KdpE